jgi:hypothetical protein
MHDHERLQGYVNNFRRHLSGHLRPGVGMSSQIHPARGEGAILELSLGAGTTNQDQFAEATDTVNQALHHVPQRLVGGNLDGVRFGGTNISLEPQRIVIIKGDDSDDEWNDMAARRDVQKILSLFAESSKR